MSISNGAGERDRQAMHDHHRRQDSGGAMWEHLAKPNASL